MTKVLSQGIVDTIVSKGQPGNKQIGDCLTWYHLSHWPQLQLILLLSVVRKSQVTMFQCKRILPGKPKWYPGINAYHDNSPRTGHFFFLVMSGHVILLYCFYNSFYCSAFGLKTGLTIQRGEKFFLVIHSTSIFVPLAEHLPTRGGELRIQWKCNVGLEICIHRCFNSIDLGTAGFPLACIYSSYTV